MKSKILFICVAFLMLSGNAFAGTRTSTFDCDDWDPGGSAPTGCANSGYWYKHLDINIPGTVDGIYAAFNMTAGNGGKAYRHQFAPNSGGVKLNLGGSFNEYWLRFYHRYTNANPPAGGACSGCRKTLYMNAGGGPNDSIVDAQNGAFRWHFGQCGGDSVWGNLNGGGGYDSFSDGAWHSVEVYRKAGTTTGIARIWVDGVLVMNHTNIDTCSGGNTEILFGSNSGGSTMWADYDDVHFTSVDPGDNYPSDGYGYSGIGLLGGGGGGDTVPPAVSITSPTQGQTVSGTITVSASASDTGGSGVAGVQFKLDGADLGAEDATSPYSISFDTTTNSDGSHTFTAIARDGAGNQTTSSPVSITISNGGSAGGTILFNESFEDANFASRGWYDNTSLVTSTTEYIPGSTRSAEFHFLQGATTPTSGGAIRKLFTATDEIYVSYWIKHSPNWTGSNQSYHPHQFYILTNLAGNYSSLANTEFTAYIETNEGVPHLAIQDSQNIDASNIGVDLVGVTENRAVAGCNGDSDSYGAGQGPYNDGTCYDAGGGSYQNGKSWLAASVYFQDTPGQYYKNDWHFIEVYFKLNSISGGIGQADGIMKYWYDGNLIIDHSDVVLRTAQHPNMKFNQFIIAPYIGNGSPVDQSFWIDELNVATSRVSSPPSPPTGLRILSVS